MGDTEPGVVFVGGPRIDALAAEVEGAGARAERRAARDASEALDVLARSDACVAVVDMTLPGLRGAEGWQRARARWSRSVVVVCAEGDDACARAALADGAEDALEHGDPLAPIALRRAIARAVARGRGDRTAVALRSLEARWDALQSVSRWYVMEIDEHDRITYLNRTAPEAPDADVRGRSVFDFTHPDAHDAVRARLAEVRRTGEAVIVEERAHGTIGDESWFVARCLPVKDDGRVVAILVLTEDVSERHRMEKRLQESERRFRALIERSSDAIVLLDRDGRCVYASPAMRDVLGYAPEEIVGTDFLTRVHPDDVTSVVGARNAMRATHGQHVTNEVRLRHKDGSWRHVQGVGTNLLDDPAVGAVVGNIRDVTAQRALEEQVRRAQQWEAMGHLAGGIAHDFNNLLCVIMTATSAIEATVRRDADAAAALDDVNTAAARAAELTRKLLALGRRQPLAMEYLDAADLLDEFAPLVRRTLGEDVELVVDCERPLPVRVDRLQIEQVLLNVCTNARQAMPGGGRVRIEGRLRAPAAGGREGDGVVEIAVHDDGTGIDEATRRRAFEPFFTTKRGGSGLGLTVAYGIVERHEGGMTIESDPGRGTVVRVRLPVRDGPRSERRAIEGRASAADAGVRVLVAEDEPALRRIFGRVLRARGYEVIEAVDGEDAIAKLAADRGPIALAILDVRMPGLSGPAAYARMREQRPDLRVLFVTGHAPDSVSLPRGAPLLLKPFTNDALVRAVESARLQPGEPAVSERAERREGTGD